MQRSVFDSATAGVVAAGCGLAVSEIASGVLHQRVSPVLAASEVIIRHTPGRFIELAISLVGTHDKQLLIAMTLAGFAVLSAVAGVAARRNIWFGLAGFAVLGVLAMSASRARLQPASSNLVPAIAGSIVALALLKTLVDRIPPETVSVSTAVSAPAARNRPADDSDAVRVPADPGRRTFLSWVGVAAAAAVVGGVVGRGLARSRAAVEAARLQLRLPVARAGTPPGADLGIAGVAPWVTPVDKFYRIDTALSPPTILPKDWSLHIHGMVDHEVDLSYHDLLRMGLTEAWMTLCCVSNPVGGPLISNAKWAGVRVADVLALAGPHPDADAVKSRSYDGWTSGTPMSALTDGRDALLAVTFNGVPLTPEHGFPVRMVVPGLYGYVSATKWIVDMEVTKFSDFQAFWTQRGWSAQGPVKTESRIDAPRGGDTRRAGTVMVGGVAWAQHRGIAKVEVKIGNAHWTEATLGVDPSIDSWVQWSYAWDATPGTYQISCRATDRTGATQTSNVADVLPDGATGYPSISVMIS